VFVPYFNGIMFLGLLGLLVSKIAQYLWLNCPEARGLSPDIQN